MTPLLAAAAIGCGGDSGRGGAIVVGMRSDFGGFNPITTTDQYGGELINYALFTPLVQYDDSLGIRPHLAESWEAWGDTAMVFHLRQDVHWHDGVRVTAADVVFTFERAKAPETASLLGQAFLADVASAEAIDSFTVRFHYVRPHAQALEDFWWAPAPRHLLESVAPADLRSAPYNRQPVGSGPFRFVEWRANERVVLEPNPDHPIALGGPPRSRIILRIVPEASTMLTELITGGVHVDVPVLPEQVERIGETPELQLFAFPGRTVYYIGWNHARPPLDNPRVRRGLALAIDRQQIIDGLLAGQGSIATSTIPPWHPLYPRETLPLTHSLEESDRLLTAAGWVDRNGDGIREDSLGRPLRFTLLSSDDPLRRSVVEVLERQLRNAGAQAEVRVTEFQTMLAQHRSRDFDAVFTNWILDNFRVASAPFALFHSSQADIERSANRSSVRIAALDHWIEEGGAATDPERQREVWRSFTELIQIEQPVTFMFWLNELAASTSVTGVAMDPRGEFLTIQRWAR
ncbi:MAG: ABC transporter substrate-binding protein [Gemmatimonadetes bacterium]|nr:ABC transporter substrate-binding protein [Gemmatimonadota bacterium]